MPELLFRLRGVPEDEAEEVRALLAEHDIRYYETDEGNWKIAVPAIWLPNPEQLHDARELIRVYQAERLMRARQEHEELLSRGQLPSLWGKIQEHPLRFIAYVTAVAVVLYLSVAPFLDLGS